MEQSQGFHRPSLTIIVCVMSMLAGGVPKPISAVSDSVEQAEILLQFRRGITKDPLEKLRSWSNSSLVCERWSGISCNNQAMVVSIAISGWELEGSITPLLGSLPSLVSIDVSSNILSGHLPSSLGMLSELQSLNLSSNVFAGAIPASLSNCTSLALLDASNNELSFHIPEQLGSLPYLKALLLSHNLLQGTIPPSLSNCSSLKFLDLSHNHLVGSIPRSVGNLINLLSFTLASNNLSGEIPGEIGYMVSLQGLDMRDNAFVGGVPVFAAGRFLAVVKLSNNMLSGGIPRQLGQMQSLRVLHLDNNELTGGLPSTLGGCTNMEDLILSHNMLSGRIPASVAGLPNLLLSFALSHNLLSGSIPSQIGVSFNLQSIDLSHNKLSGTIPAQIGASHGLQSLDLSSNQLSGPIPQSLGSLSSLTFILNLSHNALRGPIPALENFAYLTTIDLSSNQLNGSMSPDLTNLPSLVFLNVSFNRLEGCFLQGNETFLSKHPAALWVQGNPNLCVPFLPGLCQNNACGSAHLPWFFWILLCSAFLVLGIGIYFYKSEYPRFRYYCSYRMGTVQQQQNLDFVYSLYSRRKFAGQRRREFARQSISDQVAPETFRVQRIYEEAQMFTKTSDFSAPCVTDVQWIGSGASSDVYKVEFSNLEILALKLFKRTAAVHIFDRELKTMLNIRHRNLVAFKGVNQGNDTKAIFMDYMENGSLKQRLYENVGPHNRYLCFGMRFQIARDVAAGLSYLHHDAYERIVHCDLKPANILLDRQFTAYVADFGLADDLLAHDFLAHVPCPRRSTVRLRGTPGYLPPEYGTFSNVPSTEGDVYSYGVVLLELLTRTQAAEGPFPDGCYSLPDMVRAAIGSNTLESVLDPLLQDRFETRSRRAAQVSLLVSIALSCAKPDRKGRPTMKQVSSALERHPTFLGIIHGQVKNYDFREKSIESLLGSRENEVERKVSRAYLARGKTK